MSYILKIVLLGEANVGKTSLVYRFIENKFRENYKSTLGVNLLKKDLNLEIMQNLFFPVTNYPKQMIPHTLFLGDGFF